MTMFRLKTSEELVIFVNFARVAHDKNIKKTKINYYMMTPTRNCGMHCRRL
jgi:hypothetical protein